MIRGVGEGAPLLLITYVSLISTVPRWSLPLFRWSVFALACLYLWDRLHDGESTVSLAWIGDRSAWNATLITILLLMPVNWGLEAAKWRLLMRTVAPMPLARAFLATLAGTSVSLVTPNRTGEFVGRVLFVPPETRITAAALTVLGSIAQVLITFLAGAFCVLVMHELHLPLPMGPGWSIGAIAFVATVLAAGCAVLFLFPELLRHLFDIVPFLRRYDDRWRALQAQPRSRSLTVLAMSAMRYAVFIGQGMLAFASFAPEMDAMAVLLGLPVVYLLATLVPTMLLTDLGVRGSVAVLIFTALGGVASHVLLAMSMVWTINVLLPALVGSLVLLVARIRTTKA